MTHLFSLPIELRCELLYYSNDPYWMVNEVMQLLDFQPLQNNKAFCENFAQKYISSKHYNNFAYQHISQLFLIPKRSLYNNIINYITLSLDNIAEENVINAAKFNWDLYIKYIDFTDKHYKRVNYHDVVVEASYWNSLKFIEMLYREIFLQTNRWRPSWYWYTELAGITIAYLQGNRSLYKLLKPHNVGTTFTVTIEKMLNKISDRFINENWRKQLNISIEKYLELLCALVRTFIRNRDLSQIYNEYVSKYGQLIRNILLNLINKSHIEWTITKHDINCKPNILFLLSIGMDKTLLTNDQLTLLGL